MTERVWAVVAARTGPSAKSRLGDALGPAERSALAVAMLSDVLRALSGARLAGTVAVLDSPRAPLSGALVVPDPGRGLVAAVDAGVRAALDAGADAVVVLPGDLPLLGSDDVSALVAAARAPRAVVVAPDRHGIGTNALVLRPPSVIAPAFGAQSARRHLAAAAAAGAEAYVVERVGIALDIDTPADLRQLLARRPAGATAMALG